MSAPLGPIGPALQSELTRTMRTMVETISHLALTEDQAAELEGWVMELRAKIREAAE